VTAYLLTVKRESLFGCHEGRMVIRDLADAAGIASFITDGDWSCRPLADNEEVTSAQRGADRGPAAAAQGDEDPAL
jgi:hypothetical protein